MFDISWARDVALLESSAEFVARFVASARGKEALAHAASPAAAGGGGSGGGPEAMDIDGGGSVSEQQQQQQQQGPGRRTQQRQQWPEAAGDPGPLPVLASACPGWVCYAEKTHGRQGQQGRACGVRAAGVIAAVACA